MNRYTIDPSWLRCGRVVFAGSPITKFTLTSRGLEVATAVERGDSVEEDDLIRRFVAVGAIHPMPVPNVHRATDVTVVVPALVNDDRAHADLERLAVALGTRSKVIIVDDCSVEPISIGSARVIRSEHRLGPAGARNLGLRNTDTPFVLFVDADVIATDDIVPRLLEYFTDDKVALVAPRIHTQSDESLIAGYESRRSALDMGHVEANVRPGTRVSYVPSATWLCRTEAIRSVGGFDESLRTGEDVDMVWRLTAAGWTVRYEPSIGVDHRSRDDFKAFISQRVGYGESAGALSARHGDLLAPVRLNPTMLAGWVVAIFSPLVAFVFFAVDALRLGRTLAETAEERKAFVRITSRNLTHSAQLIARAVTRVWWPLAIVLAVFSRRARTILAVAAVTPAMIEWLRDRPRLDPIRYTLMRLLDDTSYGLGVWRGAIRERQTRPLLIALSRATRYREGR